MKTLDIKMNGKSAEILFYGSIGSGFDGITAKDFNASLKSLGKVSEINMWMSSEGGDVFEGMSMYNILRRQNARIVVNIDSVAASAASLVAMAANKIRMPLNATMMIHDPWGMSIGTAEDMRAAADTLEMLKAMFVETYATRSGQEPKIVSRMMAEETWMNASTAMELGFADELIEERRRVAAAVRIPADWYKNTPREFLSPTEATQIVTYREKLKAMSMRTMQKEEDDKFLADMGVTREQWQTSTLEERKLWLTQSDRRNAKK